MIVYKTTNLINGKIYVGKDEGRNPGYLGSGDILKKAIEKYGKENFKKEILEICNIQEQLCEREKFWIKKLDARNPEIGYNIMEGGQGVGSFWFGKKRPIEQNKKHSEFMKGKKYLLGCKWSNDSREKMKGNKNAVGKQSFEHIRKKVIAKSKAIVQLTLDGQIIRKWESATVAARELKIPQQNICKVCLGQRKQAHNYKWEFDKNNA